MVRVLTLGDTTFTEEQMLPSFSYSATARKALHARRSGDGTLRTQLLYKKYQIIINGISIDHFPDLEAEYEKDEMIDLSSITVRRERFDGDNSTLIFYVSRQTRLDANYEAVVEYPIGTVLEEGVDYTVANAVDAGVLKGEITFTSAPATGTKNISVTYYPILSVYVTDCRLSWGEWTAETSWQLTCEEA